MSHQKLVNYVQQNLARRKDIYLLLVRVLVSHLNKRDQELSLKVRDVITRASTKNTTTLEEQNYARLVASHNLKKLVGKDHWEQVLNQCVSVMNT